MAAVALAGHPGHGSGARGCYEGNYGLEHTLSAARAENKAAER